jgi:hypothetical protein
MWRTITAHAPPKTALNAPNFAFSRAPMRKHSNRIPPTCSHKSNVLYCTKQIRGARICVHYSRTAQACKHEETGDRTCTLMAAGLVCRVHSGRVHTSSGFIALRPARILLSQKASINSDSLQRILPIIGGGREQHRLLGGESWQAQYTLRCGRAHSQLARPNRPHL